MALCMCIDAAVVVVPTSPLFLCFFFLLLCPPPFSRPCVQLLVCWTPDALCAYSLYHASSHGEQKKPRKERKQLCFVSVHCVWPFLLLLLLLPRRKGKQAPQPNKDTSCLCTVLASNFVQGIGKKAMDGFGFFSRLRFFTSLPS